MKGCVFKNLFLHLCYKTTSMKKEISKLFLNIAQLIIGGIILNSISAKGIETTKLLIVGSIVAALLIAAGFIFLWLSNKNIK